VDQHFLKYYQISLRCHKAQTFAEIIFGSQEKNLLSVAGLGFVAK
jgi:hypothetical protein